MAEARIFKRDELEGGRSNSKSSFPGALCVNVMVGKERGSIQKEAVFNTWQELLEVTERMAYFIAPSQICFYAYGV